MSVLTIAMLLGGFALLTAGAESLVRGASRLAIALGLSPLIVGLTVVAFGTSAPEMITSVVATFNGQADIAVGNVVGSNIFNVLFILGLSALVTPLAVAQKLVRIDVPVMIGVSILAAVMAWDGSIGRVDGALLFAGIIAYTFFGVRQARRETAEVKAEYDEAFGDGGEGAGSTFRNIAFVAAGLALLALGSRWLVLGAVDIARALGVSELVIGLTIVAGGTSLPEVATSVMASIRGERDIAVGNVVGSNIFNILAVLGLAGLFAPDGVAVAPAVLRFDIPVMIAVAAACLPVFFTGHGVSRWEGGVFLAYYAAYTAFIVLKSTEHDALPAFSAGMFEFVVPITALTVVVVVTREFAKKRRAAKN